MNYFPLRKRNIYLTVIVRLLSLLRHFSSSENERLKNLIHVTDCYCTFLFQVFVILKKAISRIYFVLCTIKVSPFLFFIFNVFLKLVVAVSSSVSALDTLPSAASAVMSK